MRSLSGRPGFAGGAPVNTSAVARLIPGLAVGQREENGTRPRLAIMPRQPMVSSAIAGAAPLPIGGRALGETKRDGKSAELQTLTDQDRLGCKARIHINALHTRLLSKSSLLAIVGRPFRGRFPAQTAAGQCA